MKREAIQQVREVEREGRTCLAVEFPKRTYIYLIQDREEREAAALWQEINGQPCKVWSQWEFAWVAKELSERFNWTTVLNPDLAHIKKK